MPRRQSVPRPPVDGALAFDLHTAKVHRIRAQAARGPQIASVWLLHTGMQCPSECVLVSHVSTLQRFTDLKFRSRAPRAYPVVWIHPLAPSKPVEGAPCNGCGLCCLVEPCPVGRVLSRRRSGACSALRWSDANQRYGCGLLVDVQAVTGLKPAWAQRWISRWARRWIAAGAGCDAALEVDATP